MIKLVLVGNPKSTNNVYRHTGHRTYMTTEGKNLKQDYILQAKIQYRSIPLLKPLKIALGLYFGDKRTRDIDNYCKVALDALSGTIWGDDSQIYEMCITKHIDVKNPRIEVEIEEL